MSTHLALSLLATHRCTEPACARVIQQAIRILRNDTPRDLRSGRDQQRENRCAPGGRANDHPGTTCTPSGDTNRKEAEVDIISPQPDRDPQAHITQLLIDLNHVRALLANAIAAREGLVHANQRLYNQSRHWFIDDGAGYCLACGLVEKNARHAPRAGVAA